MKLPFYKQETRFSCVPACLRMIFSHFGLHVPEEELRRACDSTDFGTSALNALDAARRYGFAQTGKYTLTIEELAEVAATDKYPIVFVNLWPIDQIRENHALIIIAITGAEVSAIDPAQGERLIPRPLFDAGWAMRDHLAIIIDR